MRNNKLIQILKDKSGASLVLVLGIMLLLMAIGVSALAAASANAGAGINQQIYNQLTMYAESAQKTIMYSLQTSSGDCGKRVDDDSYNTSQPVTLGGQFIKALYLNKVYESEESIDYDLPSVLELKLDDSDIPIMVNVEFTNYNVDITPFAPYVPEIPDDTKTPDIDEYVPAIDACAKSASIRAEVTFKIRAEQNDKAVTYAITYQLMSVDLMMGDYSVTMTNESPIMEIVSTEIEWRVMAYDKIEN